MLRVLLLHWTNLALAAMATAQMNLVPNPGFEDTTYCAGWPPPQVEASAWHTPNTATPDIWNCDLQAACGYHVMDPNDAGIQLQGYTYAYEGSRFVGGYQWYGPGSSNTRDYLSARLVQPLQSGTRYRVSLYCARPSGVNGAVDHIGVHLGWDSLYMPFPTTLPLVPQARLRSLASHYLEDTAWVAVADTVEAVGGEQWITFGTFEDADDVDGVWLGWGSYPPAVYYYMDLISVVALEPQSVAAVTSTETSLLVRGDELVWVGSNALEELVLLDATGRLVWSNGGMNAGHGIPLPADLAPGSYIAIARFDGGQRSVRFVQ